MHTAFRHKPFSRKSRKAAACSVALVYTLAVLGICGWYVLARAAKAPVEIELPPARIAFSATAPPKEAPVRDVAPEPIPEPEPPAPPEPDPIPEPVAEKGLLPPEDPLLEPEPETPEPPTEPEPVPEPEPVVEPEPEIVPEPEPLPEPRAELPREHEARDPSDPEPVDPAETASEPQTLSSAREPGAAEASDPAEETLLAEALKELVRAIDRNKRYPRAAQRAGYGGVVELEVRLTPDGILEAVSIAATSGRSTLDTAALQAADRLKGRQVVTVRLDRSLQVRVPIRFSLD